MADALTALTKLLVVCEVHEDESGATLRFQPEAHGYLPLRDPNYATQLRLARRSQERQHPVGVCFGEGQAITELIRADNDVPADFQQEEADQLQVFFQGHDGVFLLKADHPEFARLHALLTVAQRQQSPVWFIAQKPDLTLLDVRPIGTVVAAQNQELVG